MKTWVVVAIGAGAYVAGCITGVIAMKDSVNKVQKQLDDVTNKIMGLEQQTNKK